MGTRRRGGSREQAIRIGEGEGKAAHGAAGGTMGLRTTSPPCHHSHIAPLKMELTLGSETSAFETQTPGNNPEDCILHPQHGESLKSTISLRLFKGLRI
jgi:hypothetical protein